eukprot:857001-Heterocapsa_arctica.AAC.1
MLEGSRQTGPHVAGPGGAGLPPAGRRAHPPKLPGGRLRQWLRTVRCPPSTETRRGHGDLVGVVVCGPGRRRK